MFLQIYQTSRKRDSKEAEEKNLFHSYSFVTISIIIFI